MIKSPTIAIIVPAYNEALVIGNVLSSLNTRLSKTKYRYSIIVVDDGSSDTTAKIAKKTKIKVISHIINSGAGSAIATGIKYAKDSKFDLAATFDADGQHNPDDLVKGIDIICRNNYDLLIGSRLINSNGMSVTKVVGNKGLSLVTNFLFGIKITDSQSGLRILSNKALQSLSWRSNGFEYCSEMLWRAKKLGLVVSEYPIKAIYTGYSKSKGQNNWNAVNIVKNLIKSRVVELFGE